MRNYLFWLNIFFIQFAKKVVRISTNNMLSFTSPTIRSPVIFSIIITSLKIFLNLIDSCDEIRYTEKGVLTEIKYL